MTGKTDGTDTWTYVWDDCNRLSEVKLNSVSQVGYHYDDGVRIQRREQGIESRSFEWDGPDLIRENFEATLYRYHAPHGLIHTVEGQALLYQVHSDGLGNVRVISDNNGVITERYDFDAWGNALDSSSVSSGFSHQFSGALGVKHDAVTGLCYMRYRWYDSRLGRFISKDPVKLPSNPYIYGANNPVVFVDPLGLQSFNPRRYFEAIDRVIVNWIQGAQNFTQGWLDVAGRFMQWAVGAQNGKTSYFGEGSRQVRDLRTSPGVALARKFYYDKNENCPVDQPLTGYGVGFGYPGGLLEPNPTLHYLGSHNVNIYPRPDGRVTVRVENATSWKSFFRIVTIPLSFATSLGASTDWIEAPEWNVHRQVYEWTEPRPVVGGHPEGDGVNSWALWQLIRQTTIDTMF